MILALFGRVCVCVCVCVCVQWWMLRGVGGLLELPLNPNQFIFVVNFAKSWVKITNRYSTLQI